MNTRERNLGIDLLRVICMLAMIIQHVLGHGWVMAVLNPVTWKHELLVALRAGCFFGISCFALISGYVGVNAPYRYSTIVVQWLKVWLYSVLFTWIVSITKLGVVTGTEWNIALHPTLTRQYWYFSAYVGCFMLAPIIRIAIRKMSFKQASLSTLMLVLVFSVFNSIKGGDPFFANVGKGTMWLVVLYAVGAYFGMFRPHEKVPMAVLWGFALFSMMLLAGTELVGSRMGWSYLGGTLSNSSPETLLAAIAMLLLFSRIQIKYGKRLVSALGAASFGVYLIHDHPFVRKYTISTYAYHLAGLGTVTIVPGVILAAIGIYIICALIDMLREKLFRLLHIKKGLAALERRLIGNLWAD